MPVNIWLFFIFTGVFSPKQVAFPHFFRKNGESLLHVKDEPMRMIKMIYQNINLI